MAYRLEAAALMVSASVFDLGEREMPASFGSIPPSAGPCPMAAREAHEIRFEAPEPAPIRRPTDGLLSLAAHPSPINGRRLTLRNELFEEGALVFDRLASGAVQYGAPGGRSISVAFPGMPHPGIWTKPEAGFVCI